ncbi:unnamed protein product [Choristocarpus tenellus]
MYDTTLRAYSTSFLVPPFVRYASYAAIATQRWSRAEGFLRHWLQAMVTMFGAAEVWDIALIQLDLGRVLLKKGGADSDAKDAIKLGLNWLWASLGKDCGLEEEEAALECLNEEQPMSTGTSKGKINVHTQHVHAG